MKISIKRSLANRFAKSCDNIVQVAKDISGDDSQESTMKSKIRSLFKKAEVFKDKVTTVRTDDEEDTLVITIKDEFIGDVLDANEKFMTYLIPVLPSIGAVCKFYQRAQDNLNDKWFK